MCSRLPSSAYIPVRVCMLWCAYGGQRLAFSVSSHFLPCLRRVSVIPSCMCQTSWPVSLRWLIGVYCSFPCSSPVVTEVDYSIWLFEIGSGDQSLGPHSFTESSLSSELSSQTNLDFFFNGLVVYNTLSTCSFHFPGFLHLFFLLCFLDGLPYKSKEFVFCEQFKTFDGAFNCAIMWLNKLRYWNLSPSGIAK